MRHDLGLGEYGSYKSASGEEYDKAGEDTENQENMVIKLFKITHFSCFTLFLTFAFQVINLDPFNHNEFGSGSDPQLHRESETDPKDADALDHIKDEFKVFYFYFQY